jgi:hypothetical protein
MFPLKYLVSLIVYHMTSRVPRKGQLLRGILMNVLARKQMILALGATKQ